MSNTARAYMLGKHLARLKFAEQLEEVKNTEVEDLTSKLDAALQGVNNMGTGTEVLDSAERASSATWGDKMELDTLGTSV